VVDNHLFAYCYYEEIILDLLHFSLVKSLVFWLLSHFERVIFGQ